MKVTESAVYKLIVQADCLCSSVAEFVDAGYNKAVGEVVFQPCPTHTNTEVAALLGGFLKEVVLKEAKDRKGPADVPHAEVLPPEPGTETRRPLPPVARRNTIPAPGQPTTGPSGRPTLRAVHAGVQAPVTPAKPGTETRTPIPGVQRPTPGGTPRVVGGSPGIKRADANAALAKRGLAPKAAGGGGGSAIAPLSMDIGDEVDEDSRVTNLLETSGVLDDDDADGLFDED